MYFFRPVWAQSIVAFNLSMHLFSQPRVAFYSASADSCSTNDSRRTQLSGVLCLQLSPLWYSALQTLSTLTSPLSSLCPLKPWTLPGSFLHSTLTCSPLQARHQVNRGFTLFISHLSFSQCLMSNVLKTFVLCILSILLMFGSEDNSVPCYSILVKS